MAGENVTELTGDNFKSEVLEAEGRVLVDFWAPWCGPCKQLLPIIEEFADDYKGEVKVGKVNVEDNKDLAAEYNVMSIPTLVLFEDGEILNREVGVSSKEELENLIK
ncbi:thioredoxin [Sporohalobacter salinus]|uniref:thioredoxin n=1 Tax=Sporohalobacter salinus TaxID=1494606 RepID=UPI001960F555|nr:thioredoxin [Sporohalobacter salinus]MBM7624067.1 thioredoxin 1 [Sporohalobacter salinus]